MHDVAVLFKYKARKQVIDVVRSFTEFIGRRSVQDSYFSLRAGSKVSVHYSSTYWCGYY